MLSFMKNNGREPDPDIQEEQADNSAIHNPGTVDDQDYMVPTSQSKNVKRSTMTLAVLFSIGALCLWFMIKKAAPNSAGAAVSTEEAKIESAIAQITGVRTEMYNRMDDIVDKFYQFSDVEQVEVNELKKNPFKHELNLGEFEGSIKDSDLDSTRRMMLQEEVQRKASELELWSIMASEKGGCCMIDDKVLYKGDTIGDFTVGNIGENWVELTSEGVTVVLKMSE